MPAGKVAGIVSLLLLTGMLAAQTGGPLGAPLLTHYKDQSDTENPFWSICQDENSVMLFANRRGITTFDGQSKGFVRIPAIPSTLAYDTSMKKVYVGAEDNYGYLERDDKGLYRFRSLHQDSLPTGLITKILFTPSSVYFYGDQCISRHNLKSGQLEMRLFMKEGEPFTGMFVTQRNTFINVYGKGLFRLESDTLFPIVTGYLLQDEEILFSLPFDQKMVLLGLEGGNLSLFDGLKFYSYPIRDEGYLKQNSLSDGIIISDSLYAFSTLDGGAIVVSKMTGLVRKTINYLRGLPDDEIFAMGSDNDNGLWLSHQYGLTRADLLLPVGNFAIYKGLLGNLISSVLHNNELYVATSEGVFYLTQVRNFATEEVLVKKEPVIEKPIEITPSEITAEELKKPVQQQEVQKTKRSVFSRIFGKKEEPAEQVKPAVPAVKTPDKAEPARETVMQPQVRIPAEPQYVRKTVSRLKSVNFEFRKVAGIEEKCKQLVSTPSGILVSTNRGLYVVNDHVAKPLVRDKYIYMISNASRNLRYYAAASDGYFYVVPETGGWKPYFPDPGFSQPLYSVVSSDDSTLWAGADNEVIRINTGKTPKYRSYRLRSEYPQRYLTNFENDTAFILSLSGISYYDSDSDSIVKYGEGFESGGERLEFILSEPESPWIKLDNEWKCLSSESKILPDDRAVLKIFDNIASIVTDEKYLWIITSENQIYRVTMYAAKALRSNLSLFVRSIRNDKGENLPLNDIVIRPSDNLVYFDLVAPGYLKNRSIQYQWIVEKLMDSWSEWQTSSTIPAPLQYGTFTIKVRARDIWGNISETVSLTFTREAPFTRTTFFWGSVGAGVLILIILIVRFRERQLIREKMILEEKVKERTAEIETQKEEITSSIAYASRIQLAMLPVDNHIAELFSDHFILFRPRDIVSGDFFWVGEDNDHIFFTVADCTGHGVPGAFMSTLGISTLNEIITNRRDLHANTVLNLLRSKIKNSLHQTGKEGEAADGMDLAFCVLHKNRKLLEYAGAFCPLVLVNRGEVKEYKADRMPIGIYRVEKESFTNYEINVFPGDAVYLFSDGLTDQFGGPDGSKFKRATLKRIISEMNRLPMIEQKRIIETEFEKWKGPGNQIDDVTMIGIRI